MLLVNHTNIYIYIYFFFFFNSYVNIIACDVLSLLLHIYLLMENNSELKLVILLYGGFITTTLKLHMYV